MRRLVPNVVLEPLTSPATRTCIFSHGLGDTASGWEDTLRGLQRRLPTTRFILPTAPTRPVTVNGGMPCPAWYDIVSLSRHREEEACDGLLESQARLHALVAEQGAAGIPPHRVVLAGFSQGGALSLFAGLNFGGGAAAAAAAAAAAPPEGGADDAPCPFAGMSAKQLQAELRARGVSPAGLLEKSELVAALRASGPAPGPRLGGIAVLSGYLPLPGALAPSASFLAASPILFMHGDRDGVVPLAFARDAHTRVLGAPPASAPVRGVRARPLFPAHAPPDPPRNPLRPAPRPPPQALAPPRKTSASKRTRAWPTAPATRSWTTSPAGSPASRGGALLRAL